MAWVVIVTTVVALLGGGGVAYASADALPGDALYPFKTAAETVQLALRSDTEDIRLYREFAATRAAELDRLLTDRRIADMPMAVERLNRQVEAASALLIAMYQEDPALAGTDAEALVETLSETMAALTELFDLAPEEARPALERAVEQLRGGLNEMEDLLDDASDEATNDLEPDDDIDDDDGYADRNDLGDGDDDLDDNDEDGQDDDGDLDGDDDRDHDGDQEVEFSGRVEAVHNDAYQVDGRMVYVGPDTEFDPARDAIVVGAWVEVEAYRRPDDTLLAIKIERGDDHDLDDDLDDDLVDHDGDDDFDHDERDDDSDHDERDDDSDHDERDDDSDHDERDDDSDHDERDDDSDHDERDDDSDHDERDDEDDHDGDGRD